MRKLKFLLLFLVLLVFSTSWVFSYSKLAAVKTKFGLHQAEFQTDSGKVTVSLPSDMVPGETVSGSMIFTGNPSQFDLIIEGKIVNLIGNNFTIKVPTSVTTGVLSVVLRYLNGVEIGRAFFPTNLVKLNNLDRASDNFRLPVHGRSGVPSEVSGPFDGMYENTKITLDGKPLTILSESTGKMVFLGSSSHQGSGTLSLAESGQTAETRYTNLVVVKVGEEVVVQNTQVQNTPAEKEFEEITLTEADNAELSENTLVETEQPEVKEQELTVTAEAEEEKRNEVIEIIEKDTVNPSTRDYGLVKKDLNKQFNSIFFSPESSLKTTKVISQPTETEIEIEAGKDDELNDIDLIDPTFETKADKVDKTIDGKKYCIQLASFKKMSEAEDFLSRLEAQGFEGYIKPVDIPQKGRWNRIRIGGFDSRDEAKTFSEKINMKKLFISSILITVED